MLRKICACGGPLACRRAPAGDGGVGQRANAVLNPPLNLPPACRHLVGGNLCKGALRLGWHPTPSCLCPALRAHIGLWARLKPQARPADNGSFTRLGSAARTVAAAPHDSSITYHMPWRCLLKKSRSCAMCASSSPLPLPFLDEVWIVGGT